MEKVESPGLAVAGGVSIPGPGRQEEEAVPRAWRRRLLRLPTRGLAIGGSSQPASATAGWEPGV